MKIAVASGKGGTGKTTVVANLAWCLSRTREVTAVDCDVEEPNLHLYFPSSSTEIPVTVKVPVIDEDLCNNCGLCGRFCRYGALSVGPESVLLFEQLCHSCGGCTLVCPQGAISEKDREIGRIRCATPLPGLTLISGILTEGEVLAPPVIRRAKMMAQAHPLVIYDASPGIACPVIETMEGCDICILVTESTPFGVHDLALAAGVADTLGIAAGVVINRSDGEDTAVCEYCMSHDLPVLLTIPFDRRIAAVQNAGHLISREIPEWEPRFARLFENAARLGGWNDD